MMRFGAVVIVLVCASACGRTVDVTPRPPSGDVVVLLPDPETGTVGRAIVSSPLGASTELATERAATRIAIGQPPTGAFTMDQAVIQKMFGDAMAARPLAAHQFLLYFVSGSNQLTDESEAIVPGILEFIRNRPTPDVSVIGHTDTTGTVQANTELGRSRATAIRDRLVASGLDTALVSVTSHGEADLLVRTPDDTAEPRNRRVEVSVR